MGAFIPVEAAAHQLHARERLPTFWPAASHTQYIRVLFQHCPHAQLVCAILSLCCQNTALSSLVQIEVKLSPPSIDRVATLRATKQLDDLKSCSVQT